MSTQTDRYFSRKSSGRSGHGIRLNQTKRIPAPPLNAPVAKADQETQCSATWKPDAPAAVEVRGAPAGGLLFSRCSPRGSEVKRNRADFDPMGTPSLRGTPCGPLWVQ